MVMVTSLGSSLPLYEQKMDPSNSGIFGVVLMTHSTDSESAQVILNMAWVSPYLINLAGTGSLELAVGGYRKPIRESLI